MLNFQDFFIACEGFWITERTYHFVLKNEIERSHTEFRATSLNFDEKRRILGGSLTAPAEFDSIKIDVDAGMADEHRLPGFAVAFDTVSDKGERVSMSLKALFVPDAYVIASENAPPQPLFPSASQVADDGEVIRGYYLRDEGYSEAGAIAGRFTYQPTRQTLEMTTFYRRSVAVDQMRFVAPDLRMRTIVTYQRPEGGEPPTLINLIGFGVERKQQE